MCMLQVGVTEEEEEEEEEEALRIILCALKVPIKKFSNARCRYSDWLRAGRPKGRILSAGMGKNFLLSKSSRPALSPGLFP
jgi:hypothetical protein